MAQAPGWPVTQDVFRDKTKGEFLGNSLTIKFIFPILGMTVFLNRLS